jgi:hypothetical protein
VNLNDFVDRYKGVPVDFDGAHGAQCVDLVRQYFKDVWELPKQPEGVIGAQDFYFKHESRPVQRQLCDCRTYTKTDLPPAGSVVVFKSTGSNQYGHTGICLYADALGMDVFEQDGIANEKALKEGREQKGAYIGRWNYDRLAGWLEKKQTEG